MKKKLTSILLLCVTSLTLTLSVSASQAVPEEKQPRAQMCGNCGKGTLNTVRVKTYETGPVSQKCIHGYPYGDYLVYKKYTTYQYKCSNCSYKSSTWDQASGTRTVCHGHY